MRGAILILVIGSWSFALGFKLDALESSKINNTDNLNHHHHHHHEEETILANDMNEESISDQNKSQSALLQPTPSSNLVLDEKVRTLAEGRAVAFGFKDDIDPIIVDSPPPGINFTNCVVDDTNGYCCIDFVGEIRAAVTNPVLECVTKDEKTCHTSYVTEYEPVKEQICEENYEKKCNIVTVDVNVNETVTRCMKPLQRVCNDGPIETVHRIKRDTLSTHLKSITDLLDETLENPRRISAGSARSLLRKQLQNNPSDQECRIYFETICTNKDHVDIFDKGCERIPVRLCAEGCIIREGETTCRTVINVASRRVPEEQCEIVPQTVCKTATKLVPQLIPKEYCQSNPRELCQLKFTPNPDLPTIQPLIQRYCLAGIVLENTTDEQEGRSISEEVEDQLEKKVIEEKPESTLSEVDEAISNKANESVEDFDKADNTKIENSFHEPRKLDASPSDINQLQQFQDKEDKMKTTLVADNEETITVDTDNSQNTTDESTTTITSTEALSESSEYESGSEDTVITTTEDSLISETTSATKILSEIKNDTDFTISESMQTTGTFGITSISEETTTKLPVTAYDADIKVSEPIRNTDMGDTDPKSLSMEGIIIGESEILQATTIAPEIEGTTEYILIGESQAEQESTLAPKMEATEEGSGATEPELETTPTPEVTTVSITDNQSMETTIAPRTKETPNDDSESKIGNEEETTVAPVIKANDLESVESDKQLLEKKYRNIVPIKVGYLPSLSGKEPTNNFLSGYDKYKNELLKKQPKPYNGLLKPIKPITVKPKLTTVSTTRRSFETTIIDGFTIPKTSTTIKSKSYEAIQPKALVSSNDINKITDSVKKIIAEKISSELKPENSTKEQKAFLEGIDQITNNISDASDTTNGPHPVASDSQEEQDTVTPTSTELPNTTEPSMSAASLSTISEKKISMGNTESDKEFKMPTESSPLDTSEKKDYTTDETISNEDLTTKQAEETEEISTRTVNSLSEQEPIAENVSTITNEMEEPLTTQSTVNANDENMLTTQLTEDEKTLDNELATDADQYISSESTTSIPKTAQHIEKLSQASLQPSQPIESRTPPSTTALPTTASDVPTRILSTQPEPVTIETYTKEFSTIKPEILEAATIISTNTKSLEEKLTGPKSTTPQSTSTQSAIQQSTTQQSTTTQTTTPQSTTKQTTTPQYSTKQTTTPQSTTTQTTTSQSTTIQTATPQSTKTKFTAKSIIPQSTTKQSTIPHSTTTKSASMQSTTTQYATKPSSTTQSTTSQSTTTQSTTSQSTTTKSTTTKSTTITTSSSSTTQSTTSPFTATTKSKENIEIENAIDTDSKTLVKAPRSSGVRKPKRDKFNIIRPIATYHFKPQQNQNSIKSLPKILVKHLNKKSQGQLKRTGGLLELLYN